MNLIDLFNPMLINTAIQLKMLSQPDDETCGPTSLHAAYNFFNDPVTLKQVIKEVSYLEEGGTSTVYLGCHALNRGYKVEIYTYNLKVFDPTWFPGKPDVLINKLKEQLRYKKSPRLQRETNAYLEFIERGGTIMFKVLNARLLKKYFSQGIPILAVLNATYLYGCSREFVGRNNVIIDDNIRGYPAAHFVVLCGYHKNGKNVIVADPYKENPVSQDNYYTVDHDRLINAILLGNIAYDSSLLIISPHPA